MYIICLAGETSKAMQDTNITGKMCWTGFCDFETAIWEGKFLLALERFLESLNGLRIWHKLAEGNLCTHAHLGMCGAEAGRCRNWEEKGEYNLLKVMGKASSKTLSQPRIWDFTTLLEDFKNFPPCSIPSASCCTR